LLLIFTVQLDIPLKISYFLKQVDLFLVNINLLASKSVLYFGRLTLLKWSVSVRPLVRTFEYYLLSDMPCVKIVYTCTACRLINNTRTFSLEVAPTILATLAGRNITPLLLLMYTFKFRSVLLYCLFLALATSRSATSAVVSSVTVYFDL